MEQDRGVGSTLGYTEARVQRPGRRDPQVAPRGTLAGAVVTITILIMGYVGVGFARLLF